MKTVSRRKKESQKWYKNASFILPINKKIMLEKTLNIVFFKTFKQ